MEKVMMMMMMMMISINKNIETQVFLRCKNPAPYNLKTVAFVNKAQHTLVVVN